MTEEIYASEDWTDVAHCDGCGEDYDPFQESHVGHVIPPAEETR